MSKDKKQVCIIGLGLFGLELARSLAGTCEVIALDKNEALVNQVIDDVDRALILDATDFESLRSVVTQDCDEAIVGISEHLEASILCTLNLKKIGVKRIRAKAVHQDHETVLRAIGADEIIFPERESAGRLARQIEHSNLLDYIPISDEYTVADIAAPAGFIGKSLIEMAIRRIYGVLVIAVKRGPEGSFIFMPEPNFVIQKDDVLMIIGKDDNITSAREA